MVMCDTNHVGQPEEKMEDTSLGDLTPGSKLMMI